VDQRFES